MRIENYGSTRMTNLTNRTTEKEEEITTDQHGACAKSLRHGFHAYPHAPRITCTCYCHHTSLLAATGIAL